MPTTTNLGLTTPTVGGSNNTWGDELNAAIDGIDALFAAAGSGTSVGLRVGSGRTLSATSGTLLLPATASPAQTADGSVVWDSDDNLLTVGTGSARKVMVDTDSTQTLTGKTITATSLSLSNGAILASTYTPTATNISGTSGFTVSTAFYFRIGNIVQVNGLLSFTASFASTCQFTLTLPVTSNLGASSDLAGAGGLSVGPGANIIGDSASDVALVSVIPGTTGAMSLSYTFAYLVI